MNKQQIWLGITWLILAIEFMMIDDRVTECILLVALVVVTFAIIVSGEDKPKQKKVKK